jgi:hypothetical protein
MARRGHTEISLDGARARIVVPFPAREGDSLLRAAYDRYRAVAGSTAPDTICTRDVAEARATLTQLLLADGWDAPAEVREQLRRDEQVLRRVLTAS